MTKIFNLILFTLMLTFFFSCSSEDACETITCLNQGVCDDGTCDCTLGYEGDTCDTEAKMKFIGTYILDSGNCTDESFEIIADGTSLTDLIIVVSPPISQVLEISVSLDSANSYKNNSGSITGVYSDEMIVTTIGGCKSTYLKQ